MKKIITTIAVFLSCTLALKANNIQTANVSISGQNSAANFSLISYDISWENSWRTITNESNYDGAWIFVKFRKNNTSLWQHATLNYAAPGTAVACGHTQAVGSDLKTSADGKGIWMHRDAVGAGSVSWIGNKLRWNYGVDGVLDNDSVEVKVFAVEMVYIPQGAYYLGSGSTTEVSRFRDGASDTYLNINSESAITVGTTAGNIFGYGTTNMSSGSIPASYPKGYNAFWIMKHELSQQAYADFLNTLDFSAAAARNIGLFTSTHPTFTASFPERAVENLATVDYLSWLDWSAMRPFTELEYEKACRGSNILPIANEYAWGNTSVTGVSAIQDNGLNSEYFSAGNCNFNYILNRPMRCGAQATLTSNRQASGGTYYGVMEMSGRVFNGLHGDGALNNAYTYNVANWPIAATGSGLTFRGGGYQDGTATISISDRSSASGVNNVRGAAYGGRGARTAE
jgi:formylglycine-generating enzyme required for sulfatase activity